MRTFHIGGAASASASESYLELKNSGTIQFSDHLDTVLDREGKQIAISRNGEVFVVDDKGRERERYGINYGSAILVRPNDRVAAKTRIPSGTRSPHLF
jgi:DNA-directed RNA polymerase subunit beta'